MPGVLSIAPARLGKSTTVDWEIRRGRLGSLARSIMKSTAVDLSVRRGRLAS